jgi:methionine salvage enolase-phosphatase E1
MNELNFTPVQQQRYDKAMEEYWKEPVNAMNRNNPQIKDEGVLIATWAARANVMTDSEFKAVISELFHEGMESGDVGSAFYARVISSLKELRRLPR